MLISLWIPNGNLPEKSIKNKKMGRKNKIDKTILIFLRNFIGIYLVII